MHFVWNLEDILNILEFGNEEEKIKILETLDSEKDPKTLEKVISKLDDDSIQVRGEAFSVLILNKNEIANVLIKNLESSKKNIRGFASLVLANRNETVAIPNIMKLANDESAMVRSCAVGALGYLKARQAKEIFLKSVLDSNLDVKKSALQAIINLDIRISETMRKEIEKNYDDEIKKLLSELKI